MLIYYDGHIGDDIEVMFWNEFADLCQGLENEEDLEVELFGMQIQFDKFQKIKKLIFNELSKAKFTKGKRIIKEF